jgi:predicted TIM-barrel fold metal-dependent hydrolase
MGIVDVWMQHPTRRFLEQPFFESLRRWTRQDFGREVPFSLTIDGMDRAGVEIGLTAAWWGPQGALIGNDEVAAFVREAPGRLIGVASVDLARPMEGVRELRRCVRALGFRALRIVAGHIGAPWTQEIISLATKFPNLYVDTSAYKASRYPADFVAFMRGRGARKVMFGSNFPMLTAAACLEGLTSLGLDEEAERLFLSGNARRVFKLEDAR